MKRITTTTIAGLALTVAACGPTQERNPQPVYQPAPPRVEQPARTGQMSHHAESDRHVHDDVHAALARAPSLRGTDIGITVNDGRVSLTGTVYSENQRQTAHDVAHSVSGVRSVSTSDLRVR